MKHRVIKDNKNFLYKYVPQYFDEKDNIWYDFEYMDCGNVVREQFLRKELAVNFIKEKGRNMDITPAVVWEGEL